MVISITVNYPYLTTNIPSPIWLRTCLLQKLLVFAVYQKLADSVGLSFFVTDADGLGHMCTETPRGVADSIRETLFTLHYPYLPLHSFNMATLRKNCNDDQKEPYDPT